MVVSYGERFLGMNFVLSTLSIVASNYFFASVGMRDNRQENELFSSAIIQAIITLISLDLAV